MGLMMGFKWDLNGIFDGFPMKNGGLMGFNGILWWFNGIKYDIASGKLTVCDIENGHRNS